MKFLNYITALIFVLFFLTALSQSEDIETLKDKLATKSSSLSLEILEEFVSNNLQGFSTQKKIDQLEKVFALEHIRQNDELKLFIGTRIAGLYARIGKADEALELYYTLLPVAEKNEDFVSLAIINTGMGSEYFFLKEYDKALVHFKKAYAINKIHRDSIEIAGSVNNLGTTFSRTGSVDSALYYLDLSLDFFTALKDTSKIAQTLNNKGSLYHRQLGKTKEALAFFEEALRLHSLTSNRYETGVSSINLGVLYYELEDTDRGFIYLKKALKNAKELKNIPLLRLSLQNLTQMYQEQEQYDSAFHYQSEWIAFNDTLDASEQKSIIEKLEDSYKQKQLEQDKKIAELKVDALNNWIIIAILAIAVLITLVLYFIYKKKAKEELEATKSKFYANLAHEFRTPVSLIKSPAQQILRHSKDKTIQERSAMIIKSADQLLELFNQLLDVSKLEAGKMSINETSCNVVEYTTSLIEQIEPLADEKAIKISFNTEFEERLLLLDTTVFQKVFLNVMTNAIKFSPQLGNITVNLTEENKTKDSFIEVEVIDQGPGINEATLKRLFKRFNHSSSPNNPNGIGLGLSLSKELMQIMGGDLTLEKTSEEGSAFKIKLKVKDSEPNNRESLDAGSITDESIKILLVDDHPELINHLKQELSSHYNCHTAINGKEGLEKAIELIPDVIISDIAMPEMDGLEMSKKIKENQLTEHIPVMLLTARTAKEIKYSALKAGAVSYMNKPFDIEEIKHQLNSFLNWRSTLKEKYKHAKSKTNEKRGILNHPSTFVQKIIKIIEHHLTDEKFTIEQLAEELYLSRAQVHRKVKATTGISSSALVRNIRLEKAYQMLKSEQDLNVNEIAYACGFSAPSYFTKSFVEYFGQKPSEI